MRSRIDFIQSRVEINLEESGTDVIVKWVTYPAGATKDVVTGSMSASPIPQSMCMKAFVHSVSPAISQVRQFNEIKAGDMIMDYSPRYDLGVLQDVRVIVEGEEWSAKQISGELAQTWDVVQQNQRLYRTVLLRKSQGGVPAA